MFHDAAMDARIACIATAQIGLITLNQLLEIGLTRNQIQYRIKHGRLHRVYRRVYAVGHSALSVEGKRLAACLAAGHDAVVSHWAAADLHRTIRWCPDRTDIIVPRRIRLIKGVQVHHANNLLPVDVCCVRGIPVTAIERTIVDMASEMDPARLANLIHEAQFRGNVNLAGVESCADRIATRSAVEILSRALDLNRSGQHGTKSELEWQALAVVRQHGLPIPEINIDVAPLLADGGGALEVDWLYRNELVVLEIDGGGHARARTQREDGQRTARLHCAGIGVVRIYSSDITRFGGAALVRKVRSVVGTA